MTSARGPFSATRVSPRTAERFRIVAHNDTLASGDCRPDAAPPADVYECLYTAVSADNGDFYFGVGTQTENAGRTGPDPRLLPSRDQARHRQRRADVQFGGGERQHADGDLQRGHEDERQGGQARVHGDGGRQQPRRQLVHAVEEDGDADPGLAGDRGPGGDGGLHEAGRHEHEAAGPGGQRDGGLLGAVVEQQHRDHGADGGLQAGQRDVHERQGRRHHADLQRTRVQRCVRRRLHRCRGRRTGGTASGLRGRRAHPVQRQHDDHGRQGEPGHHHRPDERPVGRVRVRATLAAASSTRPATAGRRT